jgi:hypothetical protein
MNDVTCVYYTSNREKENFEQKIRANLLEKLGDIPLVSVSQKPIANFGKNICIGDAGVSEFNLYRQLQIGCQNATTKFVCTAEADCLYPSTGYFDFKPEDETTAYFYSNLYILWKGKDFFKPKGYSLCALFGNREYLLSRLEKSLPAYTILPWTLEPKKILAGMFPGYEKRKGAWTLFKNDAAVINIKTGDGTRWTTGTYGEPIKELPYWGSATELGGKLWQSI